MKLQRVLRSALFVLTVLPSVFFVSGQRASVLSPPEPAALRGAYSRGPFYLPERHHTALRANALSVTTTADEGTDCNPASGTGISLREALEDCLGAAGSDGLTIYVPAGTYSVAGHISIATNSFTLIGEDPLTTIFETPGTSRIFSWLPNSDHGLIANVTMRDAGGCCATGGAMFVNGSGSITLENVVLREGTSNTGGGGGIHVTDPNPGPGRIELSIHQSTITENSVPGPGGGVAYVFDNGGSGVLTITDSVISNNAAETDGSCPGSSGGGGVYVFEGNASALSVVLDNVLMLDNEINCSTGIGGGFGMPGATLNAIEVLIRDSEFSGNNTANVSLSGGGIGITGDGATVTLQNVVVRDNNGFSGGGIYIGLVGMLTIRDSMISGNTATSGGGLYTAQATRILITDSLIINNSAQNSGGGARIVTGGAFFGATHITNNTAVAYGGGLIIIDTAGVEENGAALLNTLIEDNSAPTGPNCMVISSDSIASLGGVGITSTVDCNFVPHPTDQFNNLLLNGGFETQGVTAGTPESWTPANSAGDKRKCNGAKTVTPFGNCAYVFKGGAGENTTLTQNVTTLTYADGETLRLYAQGGGGAATKTTVIAKASYLLDLPATKAKLKFNGVADIAAFLSADLVLTDGDLNKLQVKIKNAGASGKFTIDRVYLYSTAPLGPRGTTVPPPGAPAGFRASK